jgi:RimJ/RimL family protein N-acetyltransferase
MIPGKRVRLRAIEAKDLPFLRELANERRVANSVVGWEFPLSDAGQARWFEGTHGDRSTRRLLVEGLDGQPLGMTGLWEIDWHNRVALTATKLHPGHAGERGLGSDAIMTLMAWAFSDVGLHRLWSTILDFNGASLAAYVRKCGWRIEGIQRQEIFRKGRYHDLYRVAILRDEFERLPDARQYVERVMPVDTEAMAEVPDEFWAQGLRDRIARAPR